MFKSLWHFILRLFGVEKSVTPTQQQSDNYEYVRDYEDITQINFTAIFANKFATLAVSESSVDIAGDNKRALLLDEFSKKVWKKAKKIVARMLGTGGCVVIPFVGNGKITFSIVSQDRLNINMTDGDRIIDAAILSESVRINDNKYYRWTHYTLTGNTVTVTNRVTDDTGKNAYVPQWANIADYTITGVDRLPFAYIKSPVDNRDTTDLYGVPITYGCDEIIDRIRETLDQIRKEFKLKKARLGIDSRAFRTDKNGDPIIADELLMPTLNMSNDAMFNIFDPGIRDSSYFNRLVNLFELFEKQVGTSKGILTTPESRGATATEIKAGMYDTYSIIDDIRKNIVDFYDDLIYAANVLANAFSLSPAGECDIVFDWSYSMIESSSETWQQMKDGQAIGIRSKAELRQWQTGETLEDAQAKIDEIAETEPDMKTLLGMSAE